MLRKSLSIIAGIIVCLNLTPVGAQVARYPMASQTSEGPTTGYYFYFNDFDSYSVNDKIDGNNLRDFDGVGSGTSVDIKQDPDNNENLAAYLSVGAHFLGLNNMLSTSKQPAPGDWFVCSMRIKMLANSELRLYFRGSSTSASIIFALNSEGKLFLSSGGTQYVSEGAKFDSAPYPVQNTDQWHTITFVGRFTSNDNCASSAFVDGKYIGSNPNLTGSGFNNSFGDARTLRLYCNNPNFYLDDIKLYKNRPLAIIPDSNEITLGQDEKPETLSVKFNTDLITDYSNGTPIAGTTTSTLAERLTLTKDGDPVALTDEDVKIETIHEYSVAPDATDTFEQQLTDPITMASSKLVITLPEDEKNGSEYKLALKDGDLYDMFSQTLNGDIIWQNQVPAMEMTATAATNEGKVEGQVSITNIQDPDVADSYVVAALFDGENEDFDLIGADLVQITSAMTHDTAATIPYSIGKADGISENAYIKVMLLKDPTTSLRPLTTTFEIDVN